MNVEFKFDLRPFGPGNPMVTEADCGAAFTTLGWKPSMGIFDGLKAQVAWQERQM